MNGPQQLIVVSNRLPLIARQEKGGWRVRPASGGLVTALTPVLQLTGGTWVGWSGTTQEGRADVEKLIETSADQIGFSLRTISLSREEHDNFYQGFSNQIIWPLFHTLDERCRFERKYWDAFERVNMRFAAKVMDTIEGADTFVWVHDYHLLHVGLRLRDLGVESRIGFFLHIPFPPLDIFLKLPWRSQLLQGFMAYDLIGFQTLRDRRNFVQCVRALVRDAKVEGRGKVQKIFTPQRTVSIGTFPISIDAREFANQAQGAQVQERVNVLQKGLGGRKMLLGVDRLDYTKGIPSRLKAYRHLLATYPEFRRAVQMVQIVVPSRVAIATYRRLKEEIAELVGEINGECSEGDWVPIRYAYRSLSRTELLAHYRAADVALVTPLCDGMNLVAKEYCAAKVAEPGVLILSEFAGAAAQLRRGAVLVNPYDIEGMAEAMRLALTMPEEEKHSRMSHLRGVVRRRDVFWWADSFLKASETDRVDNLFVPREEALEWAPILAGGELNPADASVGLSKQTRRILSGNTGETIAPSSSISAGSV